MTIHSTLTELASDVEQNNVPWGLAIYRTTYTPFANTHFPNIIELITTLIKCSVQEYEDTTPHTPDKDAAKSVLQARYSPIIMDNKSEFDEMTLDAIRAHHKALRERPAGEQPLTNKWFCVLIDEEVVQTLAGADPAALMATHNIPRDYNKYWVKVVELDQEDESDKGWMKCSVYALWDLWFVMDGIIPMAGYEELNSWGVYGG
ncbi:hypothetical protein BJY00DRAFT_296779 [Aspergillus carlsbadensis]|nr:hypothetical protein BJY00DRAFT_296779 [Aspergillus carlsbadensis]